MSGLHQRLRAAVPRPGAQAPQKDSALVTRLLLLWSEGTLSATEVQKVAHACVVDGLGHPEIYRLASLGSWGQYPANVNRDLKSWIVSELPDPLVVRVPCLDTKPSPARVCYDDAAVMLPHLWVESMGQQVFTCKFKDAGRRQCLRT